MGETVPATGAFPALLLQCPLSETSLLPSPLFQSSVQPLLQSLLYSTPRVESPFLLCSHEACPTCHPQHIWSFLSQALKDFSHSGSKRRRWGRCKIRGQVSGTSSPGPSTVLGTQVAPMNKHSDSKRLSAPGLLGVCAEHFLRLPPGTRTSRSSSPSRLPGWACF